MAERISLKQVAAAAEVSISTASLALSGDLRVAVDTRQRVEAAAKRLGYVRDPILASLAGGHFKHTGKPIPIATCIGSPHWTEDLRQRAPNLGMSIRTVAGPLDQAEEQARSDGAAALILYQRGITLEFIRSLTIPTVLWSDESPLELVVDVIETCEWWAATAGALERVRAAGSQRPAFVLTPAQPYHWHDDLRLAYARASGLPYLAWTRAPGQLERFLAEANPDAIIGGIPMVNEALIAMGKPLPFVALIAFADQWFAHISGWVIDHEHRAQLTLEIIEQRLRYGARQPRRINVPPRWQQGTTLGKISG
jgi:DNA-binding LacI/PurR family transcriptional regulator